MADRGGLFSGQTTGTAQSVGGDIATSSPEQWRVTTGGRPQHSTPAVGAEHVYVGGLGSDVAALDPGTGEVAWTFGREGSLSDSSPVVVDGTVYVGSGGGVLYALGETDGAVQWTHSTDSAIVSSATVAGGTVFVGTNDGRVLALDADGQGSVTWETRVGAAVYSQPAVDSGRVTVTTRTGRVVALDAGDGTEQWTFDTGVELGHSSPAVADGRVVVAADQVYALDVNDNGSIDWTSSYGGQTASDPVLVGGTVYVGGADGLWAFDAATGDSLWSVSTAAPVETTPLVTGEDVLAATTGGTAMRLDSADGAELSATTVDATVRSLVGGGDGFVYLCTADGQLYRLEGAGGTDIDGQPWSDPATWPDGKPQAGDAVTITDDMDVVLDESPPELDGIHIDGGSLTFARRELDVTTGYVVVTDSGRLQIGTEDEPFEQEATITLTGSRDDIGSADVPTDHGGVKTIFSMGGKLSIHGTVDSPTWTQLDATAQAGDSTLTLTESVDWDAGDEIVVTSTSYDPALAERRTITGVDGNTVELDDPLEFQHYGEMQSFGENDEYSLDERAEVMHLSRNVVIQGDEESDEDNFGGHVMAMNQHHPEQVEDASNGADWLDLWDDYENDPSLVPEVDGVEFNRMGQEGVLARYPFHWHTYGDASGSYIRNSSFHDSYQRGVTIHGTQNVTVQNNVAYNVIGHCYFLEDGTEWDNEITDNIGALVKPFTSLDRQLTRDDEVPSVFWWIHPDNEFTDNVAAGAYGFGFWLDARPEATGLTGTDRINPGQGVRTDPNVEFGTFDNNTAHSTIPVVRSPDAPRFYNRDDGFYDEKDEPDMQNTGGVGLQVGGQRRDDPTPWTVFRGGRHMRPNEPRCDFTNNTYYYNNSAGAWFNSHHTYARSVGSTLADNGLGGRWGIAHEEDNVFIALSDNHGNPGKTGLGTVDNDKVSVSKRVEIEELRGWEEQVGRALPTSYHPMHDLGRSDQSTFEGQIRIGAMDWQYDGAITRGNVFIGYEGTEYFDLGAMLMPGNGITFVTLQNELIDSEPYLPHESRVGLASVFRDADGTLTGTDGYGEIREDPDESRDTSALYDETCSPREDGKYYVSDGYSARFGSIEVDDSDATIVQKKSGIEPKDELPAGRYEVDGEVTDTISIEGRAITGDASWVFEFNTETPLGTDPVDSGHQQRVTDPEKVTRVSSMDALNDTAETEVTLYYDEDTNTEHVKIRGNFSYDEDPEDFFYYDGWEGPGPANTFRGMMRVKLEVSNT